MTNEPRSLHADSAMLNVSLTLDDDGAQEEDDEEEEQDEVDLVDAAPETIVPADSEAANGAEQGTQKQRSADNTFPAPFDASLSPTFSPTTRSSFASVLISILSAVPTVQARAVSPAPLHSGLGGHP